MRHDQLGERLEWDRAHAGVGPVVPQRLAGGLLRRRRVGTPGCARWREDGRRAGVAVDNPHGLVAQRAGTSVLVSGARSVANRLHTGGASGLNTIGRNGTDKSRRDGCSLRDREPSTSRQHIDRGVTNWGANRCAWRTRKAWTHSRLNWNRTWRQRLRLQVRWWWWPSAQAVHIRHWSWCGTWRSCWPRRVWHCASPCRRLGVFAFGDLAKQRHRARSFAEFASNHAAHAAKGALALAPLQELALRS